MRTHPAPGLTVKDRDRVADALEAPWGIRQERRLREVFKPGEMAPDEQSKLIAGVVEELGCVHGKRPNRCTPSRRMM